MVRHVYQGDTVPQLTPRAVIMGAVLGMLMSAANLYTTLKIGWSFGVAITACVLSYVIWNLLRALSGGRLTPMSMLENNCMQSTASAAGYSTGSDDRHGLRRAAPDRGAPSAGVDRRAPSRFSPPRWACSSPCR